MNKSFDAISERSASVEEVENMLGHRSNRSVPLRTGSTNALPFGRMNILGDCTTRLLFVISDLTFAQRNNLSGGEAFAPQCLVDESR